MATESVIGARPLQSPSSLSRPTLSSNCSPRHHLRKSPSLSPTTRRRATRAENSVVSKPSSSPSLRRGENSHTTTATIDSVQWGEDKIADHASSTGNTTRQLGAGDLDDDLLNAIADHEFSSPSSYPSFTADLPADRPLPRDPRRRSPSYDRSSAAPLISTRPRLCPSPDRESQATNYFSDEDRDEQMPQSNGSLPDTMPSSPRQQRIHSGTGTPPSAKQQRTTAAPDSIPNNTMMDPWEVVPVSDDDLFGDSFVPQDVESVCGDKDLTTLDLTEATEVPEHLTKPLEPPGKVQEMIKISKFQCVICMDNVSTLTVTHCGHLYCAQCLHSSLYAEATKNKCPMCRAKIDVKQRTLYTSKTKGFWPLELKLMTAAKKGKRKAGEIS
ncbi:hypothetical protein E4U17_008001 [Claviceps sp. LM77 group G4]|nr:hypothetical protein E4U17_008001 [Claviceps sp. LM77 group G4]KAG6071199.1 hypothetical protein E4U33_003842 [Claviceps sp. LM78 group G4]KAG6074302.1 hypothetical protein E4U16_004036 [Claviceps sp. LM84 group G4]